MINLAEDIGFLVATPHIAEDDPIGEGLGSYGEVNVAMELTAPRL
jgi:hypothetical protein